MRACVRVCVRAFVRVCVCGGGGYVYVEKNDKLENVATYFQGKKTREDSKSYHNTEQQKVWYHLPTNGTKALTELN